MCTYIFAYAHVCLCIYIFMYTYMCVCRYMGISTFWSDPYLFEKVHSFCSSHCFQFCCNNIRWFTVPQTMSIHWNAYMLTCMSEIDSLDLCNSVWTSCSSKALLILPSLYLIVHYFMLFHCLVFTYFTLMTMNFTGWASIPNISSSVSFREYQ